MFNPTNVIYEVVWHKGNLRVMKTICVNPLSNIQTTKFPFIFNRTFFLQGKTWSIYNKSVYFVTETTKKWLITLAVTP